MRRRSNWHRLSKAELRLLMAGLADWESRSIGSVLSRIRRKRQDAVGYYRKVHGPLADDRLWVQRNLPRISLASGGRARPHNPAHEQHHGVLWHET
jgi:hypothetical protein